MEVFGIIFLTLLVIKENEAKHFFILKNNHSLTIEKEVITRP